jgi:hypothetical protein
MYLLLHKVLLKKYTLFIAVSFFLGSGIAFAQNITSPYSIIGIGDIESSYFNRTSGMANTGIAYRNDKYITLNNPASMSNFQNQLFLVELSARGEIANFSGSALGTNASGKDFSVERISLGIRINKWWGSSIGLMPFSTSNYYFTGTTSLQGTPGTILQETSGSGGINRYFFANGFRISKNLSIGVTTSFLGGSFLQQDTLLSPDLNTGIFTTKNVYIRNWYFDYGLQYRIPISKKWEAAIGATYAIKTGLRAQTSALVMDEKGDTLSNQVISNNYFTLPNSTGIGIALIKDKKLTFLADYRFQDWSSLNISGLGYSIVNSSRYSLGVEYSKLKEYMNLSYEVLDLQAGVFYNKSYLQVNGQQLNDGGFTIGAGFNSKRSTLSYHLAFEYGQRGSKDSQVKENYQSITIGLSYKDFWLTKGRKYN